MKKFLGSVLAIMSFVTLSSSRGELLVDKDIPAEIVVPKKGVIALPKAEIAIPNSELGVIPEFTVAPKKEAPKKIIRTARNLHFESDEGDGYYLSCSYRTGQRGFDFQAAGVYKASGYKSLEILMEQACDLCLARNVNCRFDGCTSLAYRTTRAGEKIQVRNAEEREIFFDDSADLACPGHFTTRFARNSWVSFLAEKEVNPGPAQGPEVPRNPAITERRSTIGGYSSSYRSGSSYESDSSGMVRGRRFEWGSNQPGYYEEYYQAPRQQQYGPTYRSIPRTFPY